MKSTSTSPLRLPRSLKEMVEQLRRAATAVAEKVSALQTASAAAYAPISIRSDQYRQFPGDEGRHLVVRK